jgi:D-alanine-D-alanine ligase
MHKIRVGILRGGPSAEYEVSLNTGAGVLKALRESYEHKYQPRDIFIDKEGKWHMEGVEITPEDISHRVDIIFNALHGTYGEDGKVQHFFEAHNIRFTGTGSAGSAVGMNKILSKRIFKDHEIKTPFGKHVPSLDALNYTADISRELFETMIFPCVIKPSASGSSVGVTIVKTPQEVSPALLAAAPHSDAVIIEEFLPGIEATCGVVEGFRGHELYALPPIEIRPHNGFFDYEGKYMGKSEEIVPATFADSIKRELEEISKKVHRALHLRHYSRSDFIIHQRRGIYILEVNTLPGLTEESLLPKSLRAVGSGLPEFADHLITLALK